MDFFYKKSTRFKSLINNKQGFVFILLLPLFSLIITGSMGLMMMSIGIKNITFSQKVCILENLSRQDQLQPILKELLSMNKKVIRLHKQKKSLKASLITARSTGAIPLIPAIKAQIVGVQLIQVKTSIQQKMLLMKAHNVKKQTFKKLKSQLNKKYISYIKDSLKNPLALLKKKLESNAIIYKPLNNFSEKQKTIFSWKMKTLSPLFRSQWIKYACVATLERRKNKWEKTLFH